jgi:hypothetical protein
MTCRTLGEIAVFLRAIRENPANPDIDPYLTTIDLTPGERLEVKSRFAELMTALMRPGHLPVPKVMKEGRDAVELAEVSVI